MFRPCYFPPSINWLSEPLNVSEKPIVSERNPDVMMMTLAIRKYLDLVDQEVIGLNVNPEQFPSSRQRIEAASRTIRAMVDAFEPID